MGYYFSQLKALLKRNFLLKKASKSQLFGEIIFPLYIVFMTYLSSSTESSEDYKRVDATPTLDMKTIFDNSLLITDKNPTIGFVLPKNNQDKSIINNVMDNELFTNSSIKFDYHEFTNEEEMNNFNNDYHNFLFAGIVFDSDDYFQYTLRVNGTNAPDPNSDPIVNYALGRYQTESSMIAPADKYLTVFSPIQTAVDQAIIRLKTNDNSFTMKHSLGKLSKAPSKYSFGKVDNNNGLFISLIFMMPISIIIVNVVKEKEDKIKDGLLMAGVHPTLFWLSWLLLYIVIIFITVAIIIAFYIITKTFTFINPIIFFIALFLYGLSCCNLSFIFTTFFNKSKTAGTSIIIFVIIFSIVNSLNSALSLDVRKFLSIFLSPISIGSFLYEAEVMKSRLIDLDFSNLFSSNAGYFLLMLAINTVAYFIIALFFDNLSTKEYISKKAVDQFKSENEVNYQKDIQEDFNEKNGEKCTVEVSHVHKVFPKKIDSTSRKKKNIKTEFLAVDDVSFKVYPNEIFAILGHNGAGKTTLINIMVGLLRATEGSVFFDDRNIETNTNAIRKEFGVCSQANIIYEELSVEDHINFYAQLKGIKVDVDEILREIDLIQQKKMKASKLSGGQKRKLCIGMAIIGNPKYIFLDEPTTGLDPLSRRKIWELLLKKKEGRVIFLTTHYMDEADILADRKLILTKGKIRCLGTSLYLKNHFNMNYDLDIETSDQKRVHDIVKNYLPEATYAQDINQKTIPSIYQGSNPNQVESTNVKCHTWRLPLNSTSKFPPLLNELERQMENDQTGLVKKYALNMPTLEELFIRLEDNNIDDNNNNNENNIDTINNTNNEKHLIQISDDNLPKLKEVEKPSRLRLIIYLVRSRLKIFLKDKIFTFFAILFPAIFTGIMLFLAQKILSSDPKSGDSREISVQNIYSKTYLNIDPQSQLGLTNENIIFGSGLNKDMISFIPLNEIPHPEVDTPYYLSSVGGKVNQNVYDLQIHYNDTMTHSLPATFNAISNAILASKNIKEKIVTTSHPFNKEDNTSAIISLSLAGFFIGYYMANNINRFGPLTVRERANQLLQQLQLNGVSRVNYWISCFITDVILFIVTCLLIFIIGLIVRYEPLLDFKILIIIFIFLVIWCAPAMLFQYITGFLFDKEDIAFSMSSFINTYPVIFGYLIFILINKNHSVVDGILEGKGIIGTIPNLYNVLLTAIFPSYGFVAMVNSLFTMKIYEILINYDISFLNILKFNNGISPIIIELIILAIIYFFLLIFLDRKINQTNKSDIYEIPSSVLQKCKNQLSEGDDDVKREYEYVKENQFDLPLSVLHLSKEYKAKLPTDKEKRNEIMERDPENFKFGEIHKSAVTGKYVKTAVIDVNFGVRNHECFGLLGPNGAGKSTTLNTVTSTIPQTTGKICFNGVETHIARLGDISMGYCPQNDLLWKELSLREHIELFLRIRGYNTEESREYASKYIDIIGVEEHQNKRADDLSGGTKRKLSLLIAICGYPKQILLDEPSAGMDPSTRRLVWNIIKKTKNMNDSAVIMTTHSMEEAEFLCDRLAILVNGRLSCIGSPEHLKLKFGDSYILELQSQDIDRFHYDAVVIDKLFGDNEYKIDKSSIDRVKYEVKMIRNIGYVFEVMEKYKKSGLVIDYSFNQTTLEQIFINFAKEQIINTE